MPRMKSEAEVTRVLRALRSLSPDDRDRRTLLLRDLGAAVAAMREHFTNVATGRPDWPGRTGPYRNALADCYSAAGYPPDETSATQKAARYHVANALRVRLSPAEIDALGWRQETPAERQAEIRERNAAVIAATRHAAAGASSSSASERLHTAVEMLATLNEWSQRPTIGATPEEYTAGARTLRALARQAEELASRLDVHNAP